MTFARAPRPLLFPLLAAAALLAALTACSEGPATPVPAADAGARGGEGADPPNADGGDAAEDAPRPDSNRIRWTTASEVDNYGFDVYRGDSEEGPFERLTAQPIPGAGTSDMPSQYEHVDDTIEPGREYWYYVESISAAGERTAFTPVRRAPPKPGPAPAEADASAAEGEPEQ